MSDEPTMEEFKAAIAETLTDLYFDKIKPLQTSPAFLGIRSSRLAMKAAIKHRFEEVDSHLRYVHHWLEECGYCIYKPKSPAAPDQPSNR